MKTHAKHIIGALMSFIVLAYPPLAITPATIPLSEVFAKQSISVAEAAAKPALKTLEAWVTAYSSTPEQTDDTPFITARGTFVRDGIVATNLLPFGTLIKIPELFYDKIFVVEDRMHRRKKNFIDVWMPSQEEAREFGINFTTIVVLDKLLVYKPN